MFPFPKIVPRAHRCALLALSMAVVGCASGRAAQGPAAPIQPVEPEAIAMADVDFSFDETISIQTIEERTLVYYVDRPLIDEPMPILLSVDGSSCIGQLRPGIRTSYRPGPDSPLPFARVAVEKPGVEATADYPSECTDEFFKHYTIDKRVLDHLRVLQHLKKTADWWNGELYIFGWSDGGDIAAQLTAYYPNVTRAVLGASGGGYTMAEHFEDFWVCSEAQRGDTRDACIASLRRQFDAMADNPTWETTWSGPDNAWRVWPTRLHARHSVVLKDNLVPILVVHGEKDYDSTPVQSARKLIEDLEAAGNDAYTYWEVPDMGHGVGSLPPAQKDALKGAILNWILGLPPGPGGPPYFGAGEGAE